ncbi:MAG: hypothetical protein HND53_10970 [Proteobacteria bacterium]|nr:hypothetical protein [Pseudomonadota bacterium]NOG61014.1 hypothetical protein [Pseudomonadota bacterium]
MSRAIKIKLFKVGIILSVLSCVSACGQKGDLYLPPDNVSLSAADYTSIV